MQVSRLKEKALICKDGAKSNKLSHLLLIGRHQMCSAYWLPVGSLTCAGTVSHLWIFLLYMGNEKRLSRYKTIFFSIVYIYDLNFILEVMLKASEVMGIISAILKCAIPLSCALKLWKIY